MKTFPIFFSFFLAGFLLGCSAEQQLDNIKQIERKGRYYKAWEKYQEFAASHPQHPRAPEALLALANCQVEMKDNRGARRTLDELMKSYPKSEAAAAGKERLATIKG